MFYGLLGIAQETDVVDLESVSIDDVEAYCAGNTLGPILGTTPIENERVRFDWMGGKKSFWNERLLLLLAQRLHHCVHNVWTHLPKYELWYFELTVNQKFSNLLTLWRKAQAQVITGKDGSTLVETDDQIEARLNQLYDERRRNARQNTRRHTVSLKNLFPRVPSLIVLRHTLSAYGPVI